MNLYAFDCDGSLENSNGPIPILFLEKLKALGHIICIVSPSGVCANLPYEYFTSGADRLANLLAAKAAHPNCSFNYYFTDNPTEESLAEPSGFVVIKMA